MNELMKDDDEDVWVYRVPKSLTSSNPEAFTPQFVGLGPYHHHSPQVIPQQKLKATAVKRVLKHHTHHLTEIVTKLSKLNLAAQIRNCYNTSLLEFQDDDTLLYLITVDTVFLYDLLCSFEIKEQDSNDAIVTKFDLKGSILIGMPLLNAAGIEFTKDAIIRDVFMLENQIPIHILHQIITVINDTETDEPCAHDDDECMFSKMLRFCRAFCPLVNVDHQLSNQSHVVNHDHLLDLMYHLIVPEIKPIPDEPKPHDSQNDGPKPNDPKPGEPKPGDPQHDGPNLDEPEPGEPEPGDHKPDEACTTCCFKCCYILMILFGLGFIILYLVMAILDLIFWVLYILLDGLAYMTARCHPSIERLNRFLSNNDIPFMTTITVLVGKLEQACRLCMQDSDNTDKGTHPGLTIPSVMQLSQAGICFEPADAAGNSFSSIHFDEEKCSNFYLPKIRVGVNSEVIMRNLVAYESLIKSGSLIFTRYVELMRDLVHTAEDVKVLVDKKIIQTQLSHEQVAKLFNGMSKSIRPTNTPELDKEINRVNKKFNEKEKGKLHRFITKYVSLFARFLAVLAGLALLVLTATQTYCTLYGCSATSNSGKMPEDGYNYRNNYLISST